MSTKAHFICEFSAPEQGGHISAHFLPVHKVGKLPQNYLRPGTKPIVTMRGDAVISKEGISSPRQALWSSRSMDTTETVFGCLL